MFSKLSLLVAVMWCSAAEATGHDVSQLCEDSARRFAADRVRAEEKVIALAVWCRKMSPEYDAVKCATAAAAADLEALVFRTEGEVLLKECTQAAPEGEQRKAAVQKKVSSGSLLDLAQQNKDHAHLDVVLPVVTETEVRVAAMKEYAQQLKEQGNRSLALFIEMLEAVEATSAEILAAIKAMNL